MQANLEQAIEIIRALPVEDYDKLRKAIDEQEKAKGDDKKSNWQIERYKKARKWLDENSEKYMNQWVCLEGDKLIAHSADGRNLYQKAKDAGIEIPFIHHIVEEKYP
ncbi:MAG: DUF5678 domain-containing protein [Pyrinomonadaceae bacterium]